MRHETLNGFAGNGEGSPEEVDQAVFDERVHRGDNDIDESESQLTLERTCKEWVPSNRMTKFFSTSGAEKLFNGIASFAEMNEALDYKFSKDKYRAFLTIVEEDEEEPEIKYEVKFTVDVYQMKGEDKWAVEFTKSSGDILAFNSIFKDAREYFGGLVNATQN